MKNRLLILLFLPMFLASCDQRSWQFGYAYTNSESFTAEGKSTSHILGLTHYTLNANNPKDGMLSLLQSMNVSFADIDIDNKPRETFLESKLRACLGFLFRFFV